MHILFSVLHPEKFQYTNAAKERLSWEAMLAGNDIKENDPKVTLSSMSSSTPGSKDGQRTGKGKRRNLANQFGEELMAKMKESEPLSKKKYEYIEVLVPIAAASGYAIIASEGVGTRELISGKPRASKLPACRPGTCVAISVGQVSARSFAGVMGIQQVAHQKVPQERVWSGEYFSAWLGKGAVWRSSADPLLEI